MNEHEAEALFERALISEGETYAGAERRLREARGATSLAARRDDPDPAARLLARVVTEPGAEAEEAMRHLEHLERTYAATLGGMPPLGGVVQDLTDRFGARLTGFFANRLLRGALSGWHVSAALEYLSRHPDPEATGALIRLAVQSPSRQLQRVVVQILGGGGDPALAGKLEAERQRLAAQGRTLPPLVASMFIPAAAGQR